MRAANRIEDLFLINSLHYEKKEGKLNDVEAVWINDQYRLLFRSSPDDKSFRIETAIEYGEKLGIKLVEIPEPEELYDLVFTIGSHSSCIVLQEMVDFVDYAIPFFKSNVLHSNQKQKWTPERQSVIA